jgi:hypothetical protein
MSLPREVRMEIKLIEVQDRDTLVPAMAIRLSSTGDDAGD